MSNTTGLARSGDPITSHEAADAAAASTWRVAHKSILFQAVVEHPGLTSAEYAVETGLERHEAARRLADLKNDGEVVQGARRKCRVGKRSAMTWDLPGEDEQRRLWE